MEYFFNLNQNTKIINDTNWEHLDEAIKRFRRDIHMTLTKTEEDSGNIHLVQEDIKKECFHIYFTGKEMLIGANDDLGFIYAFLYLSKEYLGVLPFWFWNNQIFQKKVNVLIPIKDYRSTPYRVRFRGWFVNDEVLISHWKIKGDSDKPWEMVFEALLRCGGNMVIPGTDKNSKKYKELALSMGLWVTHHHAEPLGAEMFARVYPQLKPSYGEYPELFQKLWEKAIDEQKDQKIIWNLGFRGQGDIPFWSSDPNYDTPQKRGELISSLIKLQYQILQKKIDHPICCTNLYGEVMELYHQGYIKLPGSIIKIWADNGYGKMVSRRQENHNPRIYALPLEKEKGGHHGIYYHASFYDLQAANHITMLPNSIDFVNHELKTVLDMGADDFWIVNCSNVKPHVYTLDAISTIWEKGEIDVEQWSFHYIRSYYSNLNSGHNTREDDKLLQEIDACFQEYYKCVASFGKEEDEHAGEQFYNYTVRILGFHWLKGEYRTSVKELLWATQDITYEKQVQWFYEICLRGEIGFVKLYNQCVKTLNKLKDNAKNNFEDSIFLQVQIHLYCLRGAIKFCEGYQEFLHENYIKAFYLEGKAKEDFEKANICMREKEHDVWNGFYQNECLTDVKQTAYVLKSMMSYIRNIGEGPHFFEWQRQFLYSQEDRYVVLITNMENHLTDEELFKCMKDTFDNRNHKEN